MFSVDSFHQEYVPIGCVDNAIRAAKEARLQVQVDSYLLSPSEPENQFDLSTLGLLKKLNLKNIPSRQYVPMMMGRAAELLSQYFQPGQDLPRNKC